LAKGRQRAPTGQSQLEMLGHRGDAIGQRQELCHPGLFGVAKLFDCDPAIGTTDHGTDSDRQDIEQQVLFGAIHTRIGQIGKGGVQLPQRVVTQSLSPVLTWRELERGYSSSRFLTNEMRLPWLVQV
jgi:hypothetical protein